MYISLDGRDQATSLAMPRYDLHSHSTHSDGLLRPAAVVDRAAARGVDVLALTDHDEVSGLTEARAAADQAGITPVTGAALSGSWEGWTIHVVGLPIAPSNQLLASGPHALRTGPL